MNYFGTEFGEYFKKKNQKKKQEIWFFKVLLCTKKK